MIEVLKRAFADAKLNERHQTVAESYYWLRQYKLLAEKAIAELESQEPDYWLGYGLQAHTEKPFENATALYIHAPQRTEQNFCSRCGKRTKDLTHIHTCTPPQD